MNLSYEAKIKKNCLFKLRQFINQMNDEIVWKISFFTVHLLVKRCDVNEHIDISNEPFVVLLKDTSYLLFCNESIYFIIPTIHVSIQ